MKFAVLLAMLLAAAPETVCAFAKSKLKLEETDLCIGFDNDDYDNPAPRGNRAVYMPCEQAPEFELNDDYQLMIVGGSQHGNCLRGYPSRSIVAMENCGSKQSWRSLQWYPVVVLNQPDTYRLQNQFTMRYLDVSMNGEFVQTDSSSAECDCQWFKLEPLFFLDVVDEGN